ncbi:MAG: hypothetical protein IJ783_05850 [Kiritimatiellae bacterium]|nr:hypothetical protein [Kiritimatiellia bacterium]
MILARREERRENDPKCRGFGWAELDALAGAEQDVQGTRRRKEEAESVQHSAASPVIVVAHRKHEEDENEIQNQGNAHFDR